MIDHTAEKDRSTIANEEGFTGTFAAFVQWLTDALVYGTTRVHEPAPNDFGRMSTVMETVTGGYSSDEELLGRLRRSWLLSSHWVRSERGGLTVYEFPEWVTASGQEFVWLTPEDGVFERAYRARRVRLYDEHGHYTEVSYTAGAEFLFQERDRDINEPDGLVIVRPAPPIEETFSIVKGAA